MIYGMQQHVITQKKVVIFFYCNVNIGIKTSGILMNKNSYLFCFNLSMSPVHIYQSFKSPRPSPSLEPLNLALCPALPITSIQMQLIVLDCQRLVNATMAIFGVL